MVIHDRGYQRWDGDRSLPVPGARAIMAQGVGVAAARLFKKRLLAILLIFVAYGPFLFGFVTLSFLFYVGVNAEAISSSNEILSDDIVDIVTPSPYTIWFYLFYFQGLIVLLLSLTIGMGLIAEDRRSNALELYLSRPVRAWQYVLGKFGVLLFFFLMVTLVPAGVLIVLQMAFEEFSSASLSENLPLLMNVTAATLAVGGLLAWMALAVSAFAGRTRNAAVLWLSLWVVSMILEPMLGEIDRASAHLVSLRYHLGHLAATLLDTQEVYHSGVVMGGEPIGPTIVVLGGLAALSTLIILRRVRPVEVVA